MTVLKQGVCAPKGFQAAAAAAGIKKPDETRLDCALIVSDRPARAAGVFTTNRVQAAPVRYCRDICARGTARAVFANSGNANACTGTQGDVDAAETAALAGRALGIDPEEVLVCSTGVIGVPLPMDRIASGITACVPRLSETGDGDAARAIMTTDTVPKEQAVELALDEGVVRIGAMAKGAGMIAPNMATMLGFITTDADIKAEHLQALLSCVVSLSFNCICVDNDMSTNDTVLCLANGASGVALQPGSPSWQAFSESMRDLCVSLAQRLVHDGEGATKFISIQVSGAPTHEDARQVAESVAKSQLCKTAFYGQDANWGRIIAAAGYSGARFDPNRASLFIQDVQVLENGCPVACDEVVLQQLMQDSEIFVRIELNGGDEMAWFWTSDLSIDYVKINADYRT